MPSNANLPALLNTTHCYCVVRMYLDRQGAMQVGYLLDQQGAIVGRFQRLDQLPALIAAWLDLTQRLDKPDA